MSRVTDRAVSPATLRKRRQRAREAAAADVEFVRADWSLFLDPRRLPQKAGCPSDRLRAVILKELLDNALDGAESAGTAPIIDIGARTDDEVTFVTVSDNGGGITPATVADLCDFNMLVSDKARYRGPTRGAQGNALKTIVAMPFALDEANGTNARGVTIIEACGLRHTITFGMDAVSREPRVSREIGASIVKTGTQITIHWPESAFGRSWLPEGCGFYNWRPGSSS